MVGAGGRWAADLRTVAMKVLSKTSSSSACERNWSAFAAVQTSKRTRLTTEHTNDLVYLRGNLRVQQKRVDTNFAQSVAQWVEETAEEESESQGMQAEVEVIDVEDA